MHHAVILLPAFANLRGELSATPRLARLLGRADPLVGARPGRDTQLMRYFNVLPRRLPVAPLTRSLDANDAGLGGWLRCDPAHVRADGTQVRLMAWGEQLAPEAAEVEALLTELRPLFGDAGSPISAPHPARWYAAVSEADRLPPMVPPDMALGADLLEYLPGGRDGLRWRQLWNDSQVILHNHPVNQARQAAGKPSINSLWFWGGGRLPDSVSCDASAVLSSALVVRALARMAQAQELSADASAWPSPVLIDLERIRDWVEIEQHVLGDIERRMRDDGLGEVVLDFADGVRFLCRPAQRRRFWRRRLRQWPFKAET